MSVTSLVKAACLSAVVGLGFSAPAFAAEPNAPQPVKAPAEDPLTDESLLRMLRGLGYEPYQTGTFTDGSKFYWVKVDRDGYQMSIRFALSPNKLVVWMHTYLGEVPAPDKITAEPLQKLLEAQNSYKGRFSVTGGKLIFQMPVDNRSLAPQDLRVWIDEFFVAVKSTSHLWNTAGWSQEGKEAVGFHQKLTAAQQKVSAALNDFGAAIRPLSDGKEVDPMKVRQAAEAYRKSFREFGELLESLRVPNSPAARELAAAYKQWVNFYEKTLDENLDEMIRVVCDTGMSHSERTAKLGAILQKFGDKEKAVQQALNAALTNYTKHYQIG
jgi:hypothetical protein